MATRIEPTEELLKSLWLGQLRELKAHIESALEYGGTGDDGHDYMTAALDLAETMQMLWYDSILTGPGSLDALLNTPNPEYDFKAPMTTRGVPDNPDYYEFHERFERENGFPHLAMLACDGICSEIYELNCPALPKEAD